MPELKVRTATEADILPMARIMTACFPTANAIIFPERLYAPGKDNSTEDIIKWRASRALRRMREGQPTFVAVDGETIVGAAQWQKPGSHTPAATSDEGKPAMAEPTSEEYKPPTFDAETAAQIMEIIISESKKWEQALGYDTSTGWYLLMIAVDPEQQRRGIGKLLMRWGVDKAASEGRDLFLTATPEGKPLYEKTGFKVLAEYDIMGMPHSAMVLHAPGSER
ncbi:acyl-CoA N-acyltransferase [Apodospora peruviana]|uniref:Acyl-CoA N-acyltransferase n=1 Tax=Apodospora peruviana TaxID=516989 RepID=A0AAE0MHR0_9PEZI|nr:acyl-CoA N-acyltransferase [Apodospora peruviana]